MHAPKEGGERTTIKKFNMKEMIRSQLNKASGCDRDIVKVTSSSSLSNGRIAPKRPQLNILDAINDETVSSLRSAEARTAGDGPMKRADVDAAHTAAIFSAPYSSNISIQSSSSLKSAVSGVKVAAKINSTKSTEEDIPLYKTLEKGDRIYARYSNDGKLYAAQIVSVMHKGFTSACYDVSFEGYEAVESISWRDISLSCDGGDKISRGDEDIDEFGRQRVVKNTETKATSLSGLSFDNGNTTVFNMTMSGDVEHSRVNFGGACTVKEAAVRLLKPLDGSDRATNEPAIENEHSDFPSSVEDDELELYVNPEILARRKKRQKSCL